jgi:hypothetical protein
MSGHRPNSYHCQTELNIDAAVILLPYILPKKEDTIKLKKSYIFFKDPLKVKVKLSL